jgi:hypothetical protein
VAAAPHAHHGDYHDHAHAPRNELTGGNNGSAHARTAAVSHQLPMALPDDDCDDVDALDFDLGDF